MNTKHELSEYELNLILMALEFVKFGNAFDLEDVVTAQGLMSRLPKEAKEQRSEEHYTGRE